MVTSVNSFDAYSLKSLHNPFQRKDASALSCKNWMILNADMDLVLQICPWGRNWLFPFARAGHTFSSPSTFRRQLYYPKASLNVTLSSNFCSSPWIWIESLFSSERKDFYIGLSAFLERSAALVPSCPPCLQIMNQLFFPFYVSWRKTKLQYKCSFQHHILQHAQSLTHLDYYLLLFLSLSSQPSSTCIIESTPLHPFTEKHILSRRLRKCHFHEAPL